MIGCMQRHSLLISSLVEHAARYHSNSKIASRDASGKMTDLSWKEVSVRTKQLANSLIKQGVSPDSIIGSLCANHHRHFELFHAIPGMGAVLCPLNPRFSKDQLAYVINHSEIEILFFDSEFGKILEAISDKLSRVLMLVEMGSSTTVSQIAGKLVISYDELLLSGSTLFEWPEFDENKGATLCYTSGTTGNPKGVLYSHRAILLHAISICQPDSFGLGANSTFLLMVPLYHANAWCIPYAAPAVGAGIVMPGSDTSPQTLYQLFCDYQVTHTGGVPTVVQDLVDYCEKNKPNATEELMLERISCGGSAIPSILYDKVSKHMGATLQQGWGMTETNSSGVHATPTPKYISGENCEYFRTLQGRPPYGVDIKLCDENDNALQWDGKQSGHLKIRGHWVIENYHHGEGQLLDAEGYFDTGDIAVIDDDGFVRLVDRAKDVIKSGGEWISSIELEHAAATHPDISQVAVVGITHQRWQERPLMLCIAEPQATIDKNEIFNYLKGRVAKWWLPNDILFVDELPVNANGKVNKMMLRKEYKDYLIRK